MTLALDTSALAAIAFAEPEATVFLSMLAHADRLVLSCTNLHEARIVVMRRLGERGLAGLHELLETFRVTFVAFDEDQARWALEAHLRYGKGRHPARLNLCDCAAYGLAKSLDAPLLFKGDDFRLTDITPAL